MHFTWSFSGLILGASLVPASRLFLGCTPSLCSHLIAAFSPGLQVLSARKRPSHEVVVQQLIFPLEPGTLFTVVGPVISPRNHGHVAAAEG